MDDQYKVVLKRDGFEVIRIEDYEPVLMQNRDKFVFYVYHRMSRLYLWKFGKLEGDVGAFAGTALYETYSEVPGIYATQAEAEACLDTYLKSKGNVNDHVQPEQENGPPPVQGRPQADRPA